MKYFISLVMSSLLLSINAFSASSQCTGKYALCLGAKCNSQGHCSCPVFFGTAHTAYADCSDVTASGTIVYSLFSFQLKLQGYVPVICPATIYSVNCMDMQCTMASESSTIATCHCLPPASPGVKYKAIAPTSTTGCVSGVGHWSTGTESVQ
jgi:hypothetical protein